MFRILTLFLCALTLPLTAWAEAVVFDRILVKINDDIITQFELDEEMRPVMVQIKGRTLSQKQQEQLEEMRRQSLEKMINDKLLAQEIIRYEINVPDEMVEAEIENARDKRGMTDEEFADALTQEGLTMDDFRNRLRGVIEKREVLSYAVHSKVLVTDSEIQEEYERRRDDYVLEKMVELAIILLPSDVGALDVKQSILDEDLTFAEAAAKYSVGPGADKGGSIGEVNWSDLADDWTESLIGVEEGGVSAPITVQGRDALLSPTQIFENRLVPIEEVRDDIFERLMDEKREKNFNDYFEKLKQRSVIVYMD